MQYRGPEILYHGTARRFMKSIMDNGLSPQSRQYVHLSQDIELLRMWERDMMIKRVF